MDRTRATEKWFKVHPGPVIIIGGPRDRNKSSIVEDRERDQSTKMDQCYQGTGIRLYRYLTC
jgi:hypothetical protein